MVTIGVDPHKDTHSAVAIDGLGRQIADRTVPAVRDGSATWWAGRASWVISGPG